jgi:hypothetical protein
MGDAGIAVSPDANSMHMNASKLTFIEKDFSMSATYSPWFHFGNQQSHLFYLSGYKRIDTRQAAGISFRYFTPGDVGFIDTTGNRVPGRLSEYEIALGFARKFGERLSIGINGKFIRSHFSEADRLQGIDAYPGIAGAVDLSFYYTIPFERNTLSFGLAMSNLGSKIYYANDIDEFLPANIGIGVGWEIKIKSKHCLTLTTDLNKLLVPSPQHPSSPDYNISGDPNIPDYREKPLLKGIFESFSDAPGGAKEEFKEITYSFGAEYWYNTFLAIRMGYFYENPLKGNRKYITTGAGLKYKRTGLDVSFLISTIRDTQPWNSLHKTMRFTLIYHTG